MAEKAKKKKRAITPRKALIKLIVEDRTENYEGSGTKGTIHAKS